VKSAPGSIAGTLGVGTVTRVGSKVGGLSVHDKVFVAGRGLWSSEVIVSADGVVKLISPMKTEELAVVPVLLSAWALLHNFKALKAGDVVIQAGGTSTIGIAVTQLAKLKGITVVNITEKNVEEVKVKAALAICGSSALTKPLQRALAPEGQLVLYTDAVEPLANITSVDVAVSAVIFKETSVYGFSLQSFLVSEPARAKAAVEEVCALLDSGKVSVAQKKYKVADLHKAIEDSSSSSLPVLSMI
jgi:NADPH:quinone reductase-like Zn-dependent oxidoreductase